MKSKKSLKSENALSNSAHSAFANKSKSSSASIVSGQTINAMIRSLKQYNQKINFIPNSLKTRSITASNPVSVSNNNNQSSNERSFTDNKVHFTRTVSNTTTKSSEMDSLADSLFHNILSISSLSSKSTSFSKAADIQSTTHSSSSNKKSPLSSKFSELSGITNSGILREFTSAENSLNSSNISNKTSQQTKSLHVANSAVLSGMNTSLNFNKINHKSTDNYHHNYHRHLITKHINFVKNRPRQGLHEYQRTINAHYSHHILLVLIVVTICCSFAGIIGYAATLV